MLKIRPGKIFYDRFKVAITSHIDPLPHYGQKTNFQVVYYISLERKFIVLPENQSIDPQENQKEKIFFCENETTNQKMSKDDD